MTGEGVGLVFWADEKGELATKTMAHTRAEADLSAYNGMEELLYRGWCQPMALAVLTPSLAAAAVSCLIEERDYTERRYSMYN